MRSHKTCGKHVAALVSCEEGKCCLGQEGAAGLGFVHFHRSNFQSSPTSRSSFSTCSPIRSHLFTNPVPSAHQFGHNRHSRRSVFPCQLPRSGRRKQKLSNAWFLTDSCQDIGGVDTALQSRGWMSRQGQARAGEAEAEASTSQPWPALRKGNAALRRNELRGLDLFTVPMFLSTKECEGFVQCAEALGFELQGSGGPARGEAFRDNGRVSLQSPVLAERIWEAGLASMFEDIRVRGRRAVGLNPNIRFYRYVAGQRFGKHIDESVALGGGRATEYTLLVYLSGGESKSRKDALVGGETVFYDRRRVVAEVAPEAGMALFHLHGAKCMLHEAKVVSRGAKYVLRSDVVFH